MRTPLLLPVALVPVGLLIGVLMFGTNPATPEGFEGYIKENPRMFGKGGYRGSLAGPANYGLSLWRNEAINVDVRPKTYTEHFNILTRDELNISFSFQTIIKPENGKVKEVVEEYSGEARCD